MTKKLIRSIMVGFCVFALTAIIAYFTCMAAYRMSAEKVAEALSPIQDTLSVQAENSNITPAVGHYIARFDGENLAIYCCTDDHEEFMYTLDVRIEDISAAELSQLEDGIILPTRQALASFEEDFTS